MSPARHSLPPRLYTAWCELREEFAPLGYNPMPAWARPYVPRARGIPAGPRAVPAYRWYDNEAFFDVQGGRQIIAHLDHGYEHEK